MDAAILVEIERSLEAFLSEYANYESARSLLKLQVVPLQPTEENDQTSSESSRSHASENSNTELDEKLYRIQLMCTIAASRSIDSIVRRLLTWIEAVEKRRISLQVSEEGANLKSTISALGMRVASWIAARMLVVVLDTPAALEESSTNESLVIALLDRCLKVFEKEVHADGKRSSERGGFLSTFLPSMPIWKSGLPSTSPHESLMTDTNFNNLAVTHWKLVFGRAARISTRITCMRVQQELRKPELISSKHLKKSISHYRLPIEDQIVSQQHLYLQFLSELPFKIADQMLPLKCAAQILHLFFPLLRKQFKSRVRRGASALLSSLLSRERQSLSQTQFRRYLTMAPVSEWNSCISELHAIALQLSNKRKTMTVGWELRVSVLALAPGDIFLRYWKDDMHALLRLHHRYSKDSGGISVSSAGSGGSSTGLAIGFLEQSPSIILRCVGVAFCNFVLRYVLGERSAGTPTETDCMEMINITQAWCFFSPIRYKSFIWYREAVLPVLVELSLAIASFNMRFALQSHIRRLLTESNIFIDDKKLVGLEALRVLCQSSMLSGGSATTLQRKTCGTVQRKLQDHLGKIDVLQRARCTYSLDVHVLMTQMKALGEITGHILIHCNTHLGNELLFDTRSAATITPPPASSGTTGGNVPSIITKMLRDDGKRILALEIFASSLSMLEFVFDAVELRSDQKVLLLARAAVHREELVRSHAISTLLAISACTRYTQAGIVIRGLTDYLVQMSFNNPPTNDAHALHMLLFVCGAALESAVEASFPTYGYKPGQSSWENLSTVRESFLQVEAVAVILLAHEDEKVRLAALEVLATAHNLREMVLVAVPEALESISAMETISKLEPIFIERFISFERPSDSRKTRNDRGNTKYANIEYLAGADDEPGHDFRWSMCLSIIYSRLTSEIPETMAYFWSEANDKISKLEPIVTSSVDMNSENLTNWCNLSIFALASACPNLVLALPTPSAPGDSSTSSTYQSAISNTAVTATIKRLARHLKSSSLNQQKVAILALGATHPASFVTLVEVIKKHESDVFADNCLDHTPNNSTSRTESFETFLSPTMQQQYQGTHNVNPSNRRFSKLGASMKSCRATIQWQTRWALLRCYRILLDRSMSGDATSNQNSHQLTGTPSTLENEELLLSAATSFLIRMGTTLDEAITVSAINQRDGRKQYNEIAVHILFMIQQDFCTSIQVLLQYLKRSKRRSPTAQMVCNTIHDVGVTQGSGDVDMSLVTHDAAYESIIQEARIAQWIKILLNWSQSFEVLADPELSDHLDGGFIKPSSPFFSHWVQACEVVCVREAESGQAIPWLWLDESILGHEKDSSNQVEHRLYGSILVTLVRFLRFFVAHNIFSALITLVDSSQRQLLSDDRDSLGSRVFHWLDECFAIDCSHSAKHFSSLQGICQTAATRFLDFHESGAFLSICIDKACFHRGYGSGYATAKQYVVALSSQASKFGRELAAQHNPDTVRLLYALILHLGVATDATNVDESDNYRRFVLEFVRNILHAYNPQDSHTYRWFEYLTVNGPRYSMNLASEVQSRIQVAAASAIASAFPSLRLKVCTVTFQSLVRCDTVIQRNMLGAVLPFLVEISQDESLKVDGKVSDKVSEESPMTELLGLMYELSLQLSEKCADQLDRVWLTLAYSSTTTPLDNNLQLIIAFILQKRQSQTEIATSKMIMWWLARWQDLALRVISISCDYVAARRLRACSPGEADPSATNSLKWTFSNDSVSEIAILVSLVSDVSCHLQQSSNLETKVVALQTMHFGLLLLYMAKYSISSKLKSSEPKIYPLACYPSIDPQGACDTPHCHLLLSFSNFADIARECGTLLRTMVRFLSDETASEEVVKSIDYLIENEKCAASTFELGLCGNVNDHYDEEPFFSGLEVLAQALTPEESALWRELCVKEIVLVLSMVSSSTVSVGQRLASGQDGFARFALTMYRRLGFSFNGDVLLIILELLHIAFDESMQNPVTIEPLIYDCLLILSEIVKRMPDDKIMLYSQVFWVAIALLNHFPPSPPQIATLSLLAALLDKPCIVRNELLHDIILCKRPSQWSPEQSSALYALLPCINRGVFTGRELAIMMVSQCSLLLSPALLMTSEEERVVLCSAALVPAIFSGSPLVVSHGLRYTAACDLAAQWRELADRVLSTGKIGDHSELPKVFSECENTALLEVAKCFQDIVTQLRAMESEAGTEAELSGADARGLIAAYVRAFLPAAAALQRQFSPSLDAISMTFRVLAPVFTITQTGVSQESRSARLDQSALIFTEELLLGIEAAGIKWVAPASMISPVAKFVSAQPHSPKWAPAVRILSLLSDITQPPSPATQ